MNSAAVVIGGLLVLSIFFSELKELVSDSWLYVFISGVVLIVVSAIGLCKRTGWFR